MRAWRIRRRRRGERGAVAVMVAILLSVLLLATALTVDLGTQRNLRADLQGLADVVALDLSRNITGQPVSAYTDEQRAQIDAELVASVQRNQGLIGGTVAPSELSWSFVLRDPVTGRFVAAGASETPTAIEVTAHGDVDFAFSGITGVAEGESNRVAVAQSTKRACVRARSYVKEWNISNSWLGQSLGGLMSTASGEDVIVMFFDTETGMLDVNPPIGDVVAALDALVAQDLAGLSGTALSGTTVTLDVFLQAVADVVQTHGTADQVTLVQDLRAGLDPAKVTGGVRLGDVIDFGADKTVALTMPINIADMVSAALISATGVDGLAYADLGGLSPTLPEGEQSILGMSTKISVAKKPVISCSGTVTSSQTTFQITGTLPTFPVYIYPYWYRLTAPISITVSTANLTATTTGITCLADGTKRVGLDVDSSTFGIDIRIGQLPDDPSSPEMTVKASAVLGVAEVTVASGTIRLYSTSSRPTVHTSLDVVDGDYSASVDIRPEGLGVPNLAVQNQLTSIFGTGYAQYIGDVVAAVYNAMKNGLTEWLLNPMLDALGATFGGGSVRLVPTVDCGTPRLVG
ncbi:hypothetical protein [Nocardioides sp. YIM 152588]|uniref:hypothetical protein n=1 Tax=Nocardioides sp. YIM 152588 TaxID=3158259 RepID=UPI0032E399F6